MEKEVNKITRGGKRKERRIREDFDQSSVVTGPASEQRAKSSVRIVNMSAFQQKTRDLLAEIQVYRSHSSGLELGGPQGTAAECYSGELYHVDGGGPFAPLPAAAPVQLKDAGGSRRRRRRRRTRKRELISFSTDILLEEERALRMPLGKVERWVTLAAGTLCES